MSTDFRAALEQWRDLADTDLLCPENPAETDWGAVVAAIAATRAALAQSRGEGLTNDEALRRGRSAIEAALPLPANYIDSQHKGQDRELLQAFYRACQAEGGTADEIHLRGIRAVLAARPAAPPAPEAGEVAELAGWLNQEAADQHPVTSDALPHDMRDALLDVSEHLFRAATLLQQQEARIAGLRSALADCGRAVGASISDDCSDDFLLQVPAEVRLAIAKAAPAVVPVAVSERLPAPEGRAPATISAADRLALAVCVAVLPGAKPCKAPCNNCRVNSAAVARELAVIAREDPEGRVAAEWLDGVAQ